MDDIKNNKDKVQKIKNIIEAEIEKELINKQNEVTDISDKIKHILRNLELLKYIVAVNYYDQNSSLAPKKSQEEENEEEKTQTQIHPAIKKLMPFCSNYNKSFGDLLISQSQEGNRNRKAHVCESTVDSKKSISESSNNEKKDGSVNNHVKVPQYVPPLPDNDETVETVNSTRGNALKDSYRVIIGNISKWIPPDTREDNSTHKWMVYIRNKDPKKDVMQLIKKVRYFLHESYQPHDIIDVTSPPFRLTRRGWGEFPIRVQLHFVHPLDKPVDIIHNLKLDMSCSGIQMLGGETVIELRLHQKTSPTSNRDVANSESNLKSEPLKEEPVREKQDVFDGGLLMNINGVKPNCITGIKKENTDDIVVKEESEEYSEFEKLNARIEELNAAIMNSRKFILDRRKIKRIIEIEHCYLKTDETQFSNYSDFTPLLKLENKSSEKTFKNGAALDIKQVNQIFNRQSQHLLSKIQMRSNKCEEEIFKNLRASAGNLETDSQSKYSMKVFRHMYLVNIIQRAHATKLKTLEPLVKWFVQRWPIVTRLSLDPVYKTVHPYSSPSEEEFFRYNIGKQRSAEWFRAKAIQKVLKSLKNVIPIEEEIWTTKQILLWTRFHGYSPASFQKSPKSEPVENETRKRFKLNESSSESADEEICDNPSKKFKTFDETFLNGLNATEKKKNHKKERRKEAAAASKNYSGFNICSKADDPDRFGSEEVRALELSAVQLEINVVSVDERSAESPSKKQEPTLSMTTTPPGEALFNKFVSDTARQIGVKITEEEVIEGVRADSVSRVLAQCASSFVEELLRRSFANAWLRNGSRCPDSLETNDILTTLFENQRFDIFTNRGLGMSSSEKL